MTKFYCLVHGHHGPEACPQCRIEKARRLRTNRGLINEYLLGRWRRFLAMLYVLVTWRTMTEEWAGETLLSVRVGDKLFYSYGED